MAIVKKRLAPRPAAASAVAPKLPTMTVFVKPIAVCARLAAASGPATATVARISAAMAERAGIRGKARRIISSVPGVS